VDTQPPNLLAFTEQFGTRQRRRSRKWWIHSQRSAGLTVFAVARQLQVEQYQSFEQVLTASVN